MILGGIFLVILIVGVAGFTYLYLSSNGEALDKESKQYVDTAIPAIISTWDKQAIIDRASPELITAISGDDLDKLLNLCRNKLGQLKEYQGAKGQARINITPTTGKVISAVYLGKANFESGSADINIRLVKHGERWQLLSFHINSKAFYE